MKRKNITRLCLCLVAMLSILVAASCDNEPYYTGIFVKESSSPYWDYEVNTGCHAEVVEATASYVILQVTIPRDSAVDRLNLKGTFLFDTSITKYMTVNRDRKKSWTTDSQDAELVSIIDYENEGDTVLTIRVNFPCYDISVVGGSERGGYTDKDGIRINDTSTTITLNQCYDLLFNGVDLLDHLEANVIRNVDSGKVRFVVTIPKNINGMVTSMLLSYGPLSATVERTVDFPGVEFNFRSSDAGDDESAREIYYDESGNLVIATDFMFRSNVSPRVTVKFASQINVANYVLPAGWTRQGNTLLKSLLYEYPESN